MPKRTSSQTQAEENEQDEPLATILEDLVSAAQLVLSLLRLHAFTQLSGICASDLQTRIQFLSHSHPPQQLYIWTQDHVQVSLVWQSIENLQESDVENIVPRVRRLHVEEKLHGLAPFKQLPDGQVVAVVMVYEGNTWRYLDTRLLSQSEVTGEWYQSVAEANANASGQEEEGGKRVRRNDEYWDMYNRVQPL